MMIKSEKESYRDEYREITSIKDEDIFLWGEELIDKQMVLFSGKIKELFDYDTFSARLINCGIIVINLQKGKVLKCVTTRFDPETKRVYINEENFNAIWMLLKKSIDFGIRRIKQQGKKCCIEKPDDIIDYSYLIRKTSDPFLENNRIVYKPRQMSAEEKQLMGARQRAIDNQKNYYFYSKSGGYVHDRSCELLKTVTDECFIGSPQMPEDRTLCRHCYRTLYIRIGCAPNSKEIPACNRFFTKYKLKTDQIQKMVEGGIRFHVKTLDKMTVLGREDTWQIIVTAENKLQLWHNNYVKTSPTERYITNGFHEQGIENNSLKYMFTYIDGYSWQKHLQAENLKNEKLQKEHINNGDIAGRSDNGVLSGSEEQKKVSDSFFGKIVHWIKERCVRNQK